MATQEHVRGRWQMGPLGMLFGGERPGWPAPWPSWPIQAESWDSQGVLKILQPLGGHKTTNHEDAAPD